MHALPRLLVTLAAVALAGCGAPAAEAPDLRMSGNTYVPAEIAAAPGAGVDVHNADDVTHTVTGRGFDTRDVAPGDRVTFAAPAEPGAYPFTCAYHPAMKGMLTVS